MALAFVATLPVCRNNSSPPNPPSPPALSTADWKMFRDDKDGIELKYPPNWTEQTTTRGPGAFPFIAFSPPPGELGTTQAGLTVAVLTSDQAIKTCGTPTEHRRTIDGVEFFQSEFAGGGPHAAYFQRNHRALHEAACYEIVVYGANVKADGPLTQDDPASRFARIADAMIDSVRFVPRAKAEAPAPPQPK